MNPMEMIPQNRKRKCRDAGEVVDFQRQRRGHDHLVAEVEAVEDDPGNNDEAVEGVEAFEADATFRGAPGTYTQVQWRRCRQQLLGHNRCGRQGNRR